MTPAFTHAATRRTVAVAGLVALAVCTTGWTIGERGLFQDDAHTLARVFAVDDGFLARSWHAIGSPTRRLQGVPYAIALASPWPLAVLRFWTEAMPFAVALLAAALARYGFRLGRVAAFLAGALTVTATSDWTTASAIAIGYHQAVLLHLGGALALIQWTRSGSMPWLLAAMCGGAASLWTVDAAALVHPITPIVAMVCVDRPQRRRLVIGTLAWWLAAVPYYVVFVPFLSDVHGYAGTALQHTTWPERAWRGWDLVRLNVTPWSWAYARTPWFATPPGAAIRPWLPAATGLAALAAGIAVLRRMPLAETRDDARPRNAAIALVCTLCLVLANATLMAVHLSEFAYRTQVFSRVWTSLVLAVGIDAATRRGPRRVAVVAASAVTAAFVAFGLIGGQERQGYFRAYWLRHQVELSSLTRILPATRQSWLVLRRQPSPMYAATEAPYLARAWASLLGESEALGCQVVLATGRGALACHATAEALVCASDPGRRCAGAVGSPQVIPYERLIVATFDGGSGRYVLDGQLPPDLTPAGAAEARRARAAYAPSGQVRGERRTWLADRLLEAVDPPRQDRSGAAR